MTVRYTPTEKAISIDLSGTDHVWSVAVEPLTASGAALSPQSTVHAWIAGSLDGGPLHDTLDAQVDARTWAVRFFSTDLRRHLRTYEGPLYLRVVCRGVAWRVVPITLVR